MDIASYIDHTILKPETTKADIVKLCSEAIEYKFAAVCVPQYYVAMAKNILRDTPVKVATVIGFPFGYSCTEAKIAEIKRAIGDGADELDMVHNIAAVKNGDWQYADDEVKQCTAAAHEAGKAIKIIIESGTLEDHEIVKCCELYAKHGVDFMKTSTGYVATGATVHAVQLMRANLPASVAIKASGGIRTFAFAEALIAAGATRLGCSAGVKIVTEQQEITQ